MSPQRLRQPCTIRDEPSSAWLDDTTGWGAANSGAERSPLTAVHATRPRPLTEVPTSRHRSPAVAARSDAEKIDPGVAG